ncbi:MAG: metalloregulator ArsR/SmtB family transcription factor [Casimicrobiaceae bacterium]|nr:metalloregulator ArsR/SmtB family transcription factor [Casimicrobiaceae bacterium]MCX8099468.1 metalloregulator ArsR/SmtB family transcription factor [Casimicrobiaceae bacterium]MDW8312503.1 metalloregulator ArsR/SmtB family transcription factor [Burkholderiales bacterium]
MIDTEIEVGPSPTAAAQALKGRCAQAAGLLKQLSNPDRLLILCVLSEAEACVSAIEAATGIGQPSLSQQLTVLRESGLVATRRDGKFIYYRIADPAVYVLLRTLHGLFCDVEAGSMSRSSSSQPTVGGKRNEH